jgi:hypothetical protein
MKALGIALLLCLLAFLAGCATQPTSSQRVLLWDAERAVNVSDPAIRLRDQEGKTHSVVETKRLLNILDATRRIEEASGTLVKVNIASGTEPNAFAWRDATGDRIALTLGMLNLLRDDYDAYAAVIGHEVAHLVLNHGVIRKEREGVRSVASELLGIALGVVGVPMGGTVANVATTTVTSVFSRDEERDADKHGINYAVRAGFDPNGAVRAWEKMSQSSSGFSIPFLNSHPMAQERLDTMRQLAAASPRVERPAQTARAGSAPKAAAVAMARLRPIGNLKDAPNPLMAGDLYVDMGSVTAVPDSSSKRGWWVINSDDGSKFDGSMKARLLVNCDSNSIAVLHTFRSSVMNGEGVAIEPRDYPVRLINPESHVLQDAVKAMCQ